MTVTAETIDTATASGSFEGWCILELMGHRRLAGMVSEQEIADAAFLRIDVPQPAPEGLSEAEREWTTQFYAPSAVYAITPCTEEIAREIAKQAPAPISRWDLQALLPRPEAHQAPILEDPYYGDGPDYDPDPDDED